MARIKQIGTGRKTLGTVDGIVYVTRKGVTYARATPIMPMAAYKTPSALKRQAIFKMVQMHIKYHQRTIKQTFTPKGAGTPTNRYYAVNGKHFTKALDTLAERYVGGKTITLTDIEQAISAYATENPEAIAIGHLTGYGDVYLTGNWPDTITLRANHGDSTVVVIVAENGSSTTINPDGTILVIDSGSGSGSSTGSEASGNAGSGSSSGNGSSSGSSTGSETSTVAAPSISGTTPFEETTTVTMSGPAQATIYYTLDGSTPTASSTQYSEALTLTDTTTVKAIAVKDGVSSSVASKTFTKGNESVEGDD